MNINEILANSDLSQVVSQLKVRPYSMPVEDKKTIYDQYEPLGHAVFNKVLRPDKIAKIDTGERTKNGNKPIYDSKIVPVSRIAYPFQKTIVKRASSFLFGTDVTLEYKATEGLQTNVAEMLKKVLKSNKAGNLNKQIARRLFSECEVAEYWYAVPAEGYWGAMSSGKFKLRCKLFSPFLGDILYPHFDEYGDMDAFSRAYSMTERNEAGNELSHEYLDVFTKEKTIRYKNDGTGWKVIPFTIVDMVTGEPQLVDFAPNMIGKIPIVYYYQHGTEWKDVQPMIERFEETISNFADTNDYFGRPTLTINGSVASLPGKEETGRVIQLEGDSKAQYLTWDQAPESIRLELDTLMNGIYSNTQTPNISFDSVKGLGNITGIGLKMLFLDAILKAIDKIEIFNPALIRRFNIIKAYIGAMDNKLKAAADSLEIEPVITPYMPSNETDLVTFLTTATAGKPIMSQSTAISLLGKVEDTQGELQQIQNEEQAILGNPTI